MGWRSGSGTQLAVDLMRVLIVADTYVPARISGALQLRDLAAEMAAQGHAVTVVAPEQDMSKRWRVETLAGVRVLRVRAPRTKDIGLVRRALSEMCLPFALWRGLRASGLASEPWDGVVWYSPTIFLGWTVRQVKRRVGCRGYLILRDLFPDWAVDAGVMRRGVAYRFFKAVERFQYRVADVIGVQTPANIPLVARDAPPRTCIEVLHNWRGDRAAPHRAAPTVPSLGKLEGRIVFVYAGNMGVAQDMGAFLNLAEDMLARADVGFLFVGRGSEVPRLRDEAARRDLGNVIFLPEIAADAIPALLRKCHVGIVALDPRHTTHNIPGKFVSYMRNGLPVLARVNRGNDLVGVIAQAGVGLAVEGGSPVMLLAAAEQLASDPAGRATMSKAGYALAARCFSAEAAARQVLVRLAASSGAALHDRENDFVRGCHTDRMWLPGGPAA